MLATSCLGSDAQYQLIGHNPLISCHGASKKHYGWVECKVAQFLKRVALSANAEEQSLAEVSINFGPRFAYPVTKAFDADGA